MWLNHNVINTTDNRKHLYDHAKQTYATTDWNACIRPEIWLAISIIE